MTDPLLMWHRRRRASMPWSPVDIIDAGDVAAWYDPSDLNTLFSDGVGTPAVVDSPVHTMLDKSGGGFHLLQSEAAKQPILRTDGLGAYWLEFDGVDDFYRVNPLAMTQPFTWSLASRLLSFPDPAAAARVLSSAGATPHVNHQNTVTYRMNAGIARDWTVAAEALLDLDLITIHEFNSTLSNLWANGVHEIIDTDVGTTAPLDFTIFAVSNGTFSMNGRFYGVHIIDKLLTDNQRIQLETYLTGKLP